MQLTFGPDDFDAFAEVKQQLIDEFTPWADEHYGADDGSLVADAGTFLSWRFDYSTGDLSTFSPDDADEFLLGWAPRKFAVGPEEAPVLCRAVQAMVEFLAVTDRLDGGVATAARVMMHVDDLVDEVAAALADDTKFGLGKSLGSVALFGADGGPLPDIETLLSRGDLDIDQLQAMLEQRMDAFNSLPFEERRMHTDQAFAAREPDPIELPFTYVAPPIVEVERGARASKLVQLVDGFAEIAARDGIKLTDAGNITIKDARRLVEALDTGDELDVTLDGRPSPTRSSTALRWLTLADDVATRAGAVERLRTRLKANPSWADMQLVDRATAVTEALIETGPLRSRIAHWDNVSLAHRSLLDDGIVHWVPPLLVVGGRVDYAEIEALVEEVTTEQFGLSGPWLLTAVPSRLAELFEVLEVAGIISWYDCVERPNEFGVASEIVSGELSFTPLGRYTMVGPIRDAGYTFPSIDDLASADGVTLMNAVITASLDGTTALELWRPGATTTERARLLADAALAAGIPEQRIAAFHLLASLEPIAEVGPAVRQLLDTNCAGHAATFLLQHDLATPDEVGMFIDVGPLVDTLATLLDEPDTLDTIFRNVQERAIDDLIDDMWRHDQPETIEVLEALGRHLSDKSMAKAARKAAIKHRSWLANRSG